MFDLGSAATRFKKGQSGNPKGRPRKPRPPASSPFAILDELLMVQEQESVSELPLEDAILIKTYQRAITGSRRAAKKIVKMILKRQKLRFERRPPKAPPNRVIVELEDPTNALEAMEILGLASDVGNFNFKYMHLEPWAVEAALKRRNFNELRSEDKKHIRHWTRDSESVKWPRSFLDDV